MQKPYQKRHKKRTIKQKHQAAPIKRVFTNNTSCLSHISNALATHNPILTITDCCQKNHTESQKMAHEVNSVDIKCKLRHTARK